MTIVVTALIYSRTDDSISKQVFRGSLYSRETSPSSPFFLRGGGAYLRKLRLQDNFHQTRVINSPGPVVFHLKRKESVARGRVPGNKEFMKRPSSSLEPRTLGSPPGHSHTLCAEISLLFFLIHNINNMYR